MLKVRTAGQLQSQGCKETYSTLYWPTLYECRHECEYGQNEIIIKVPLRSEL